MARKPTIYKFSIALTDMDSDRYLDLNLTVAQHPSETAERMMVRVLVYCLHAQEGLAFTKGLSDNDEPDLWRRSLDDQTLDWIEVGEPSVERIRKAGGLAEQVYVYSFNNKSDAWWGQTGPDMQRYGAVVHQFDWQDVVALAGVIERTLALSVTITDSSAYVATDTNNVTVNWRLLSTT